MSMGAETTFSIGSWALIPGFTPSQNFEPSVPKRRLVFKIFTWMIIIWDIYSQRLLSEFVNFVFYIFSEFCNKFDLKCHIWNYISQRKNK